MPFKSPGSHFSQRGRDLYQLEEVQQQWPLPLCTVMIDPSDLFLCPLRGLASDSCTHSFLPGWPVGDSIPRVQGRRALGFTPRVAVALSGYAEV